LYTVLRPAAIKRVGTNVLCLNAVDVNLDGWTTDMMQSGWKVCEPDH
jgi:hypothetical protein